MDKTFGQEIEERLEVKGMRASELARRANTTRQNISRLIRGVHHPITGAAPTAEMDTVERIAKSLDWDIDEARLAAGYAPTNALRKPQNAAEFIEALEALGVDGINLHGGIANLTPDEYAALLRDVSLAVEMNLRRAGKV